MKLLSHFSKKKMRKTTEVISADAVGTAGERQQATGTRKAAAVGQEHPFLLCHRAVSAGKSTPLHQRSCSVTLSKRA